MARFSRMDTLHVILNGGLVPVFYNPDAAVAKKIVEAVADGGCRVAEMTNRGDRAYLVFQELEEHFAKARPEMILGVGSIVDAPTAALYIAQGANFIVGPTTCCPETAKLCNRRKIPVRARLRQRHGNPGRARPRLRDRQGLPRRRSRRAVLRQSRARPVPVDADHADRRRGHDRGEHHGRGSKPAPPRSASASNLITKELLAANDYAGISAKVKQVMAWIQKARAGKK